MELCGSIITSTPRVYTVDFTHDCLEKIFYHSESAREFDLKIVLPCSYDTYCLKQREFITKDTRENYRIVEASAKLLGRFCSGEKQVTVEYRKRGQNGKLIWLQKTVLMSQDTIYDSELQEETKVVHGIILFKDTSNNSMKRNNRKKSDFNCF